MSRGRGRPSHDDRHALAFMARLLVSEKARSIRQAAKVSADKAESGASLEATIDRLRVKYARDQGTLKEAELERLRKAESARASRPERVSLTRLPRTAVDEAQRLFKDMDEMRKALKKPPWED